MTVVAGSQNDRLIAFLSDGEWHTSRECHEACGFMRTNSRISELREVHGYGIEGEHVPGRTGTDGYRYRLVSSLLSERSEKPGDRAQASESVTVDGARTDGRSENGVHKIGGGNPRPGVPARAARAEATDGVASPRLGPADTGSFPPPVSPLSHPAEMTPATASTLPPAVAGLQLDLFAAA